MKYKHIAIDTMLMIYLLEGAPAAGKVEKLLDEVSRVTFSTLGLGEILAGLEKSGNKKAKLDCLSFLEGFEKLELRSFGPQEALLFSEVRAFHPGIKTPDAIHLATAMHAKADCFVTSDKKLRGFTRIPVEFISASAA